jgi:hypothetical protein
MRKSMTLNTVCSIRIHRLVNAVLGRKIGRMSRIRDLISDAAGDLESGCGHATAAVAALRDAGDLAGDPERRLAALFAQALDARMGLHERDDGNLYLADVDGGASMIDAFGVLAERTPLIAFGYAGANAAMSDAFGSASEIDIIDIGIGLGCQWRALLRDLGRRSPRPPYLRLTGIDLPAPGPDPMRMLRDVGRDLCRAARAAGVPFSYRPIAKPVERVDFPRAPPDSRPLAVNAAFSLHHLSDGVSASGLAATRDGVLRRLHGLLPSILTLVEPDADHNDLPFVERVLEAYRHYSIVFDIFEDLLPRASHARAVLERAFFGREVRNIVASEGDDRVERHERLESWRRRLMQDGFSPLALDAHAAGLRESLRLRVPF